MGKKSKRTRARGGNTNGGGGGVASQQRREARREARRSPRAEANNLREVFLTSSETSLRREVKRRDVLSRYDDIIRHGVKKDEDFLIQEDYDFLKKLYKDENESAPIRLMTLEIYGYICYRLGRKDECVLCGLVILSLCNEAIEKEVATTYSTALKHAWTDTLLKESRDQRRYWKFPNRNDTNNGEGESRQQQQQQLIAKAGVLQCSGCGRRVRIGLEFFKCCGRCKNSYYCSEDCQAIDWKGGHRYECRKKGEFKVGDTALFYDPTAKEGRERWALSNECKVQLVLPILAEASEADNNGNSSSGKPQKWLVSDLPRHKHNIVMTKNLHQVRPLKWWNFMDHQNKRMLVCRAIRKSIHGIPPTNNNPCPKLLLYPQNPLRDNWLDVYVMSPCLEDAEERHKIDEEGRLMTDRDGGIWRYVIPPGEVVETCNREYVEGGFRNKFEEFKKHMKKKYYISQEHLDCLEEVCEVEDDEEEEELQQN